MFFVRSLEEAGEIKVATIKREDFSDGPEMQVELDEKLDKYNMSLRDSSAKRASGQSRNSRNNISPQIRVLKSPFQWKEYRNRIRGIHYQ